MKGKRMNWYQQGDVMIKPVWEPPDIAHSLSEAVLAEGEATGHRHVAVGEGVVVSVRRGVRYLGAPNGAEVIHPEHGTIRIPPGNYRIEQVREYDHFSELIDAERGQSWRHKRRGGHAGPLRD
jgi:hypothetical protein